MKTSAIYPFFFLLFFIAQYAVLQNTLNDPDTGWHIAAGEYILKNGIPTTNPFSITTESYEWQNISWLWDIAAALIHSAGGFYFIALTTILISSFAAILILRESISRSNLTCGSLATTLALVALMPAILARPFLVGIILFFVFYKIISSNKRLYLLPLLMILWVNIHGSFLAAITIFGAFGFEYLIKKEFAKLKNLVLFFSATALATIANPLGIMVYEAAFRTMGGPLQNYINEWQPLTEISMMLYPILFLGLLAITAKNHRISDIILAAFWLVEAFLSARYLPIFMIISAPIAAKSIYSLKTFAAKNSEYEIDLSKPLPRKIGYSLCTMMLIFSMLKPQQITMKNAPDEEITYLIKNYPSNRILNFYDYGGGMIFASNGQLKTFIDGRAETAFPPELVADYIKFATKQNGWEQVPEKYNIEVIFWPKPLELKGWKPVLEGSKAVVLVKQ